MKRMAQIISALVAAAFVFVLPGRASADSAANITGHCDFSASVNAGSFRRAVDGRLDTVWKGKAGVGQAIDITIDAGKKAGWLYIRWDSPPPLWTLAATDAGGQWVEVLAGGSNGFMAETVEIPQEFKESAAFRLAAGEGGSAFAIAELSVYGDGEAPYYAPIWQPAEGQVDVMIVSAHPDDDVLFMGSVIPTYAQQGKSAVTVYMTYAKPLRRFEAMEGAWILGERIHPVMGPFPDRLTHSLTDAKSYWSEKKAVAFITEQIRKYKPSVIVTHDVNGEYGHGAHMLTTASVQQAFENAGDPSYESATADAYGTWSAAKLYLHIYKKNKLTIETREPLPLFGGKTAFELAKLAYTRHVSQHVWSFQVRDTGAHSIREFGLFATRVGPDSLHTGMFENVTEDRMLELNPAYAATLVDRTALESAVARAGEARQDGYTAESWAVAGLPAAIAAAQAVLGDKSADQARVDAGAAALETVLAMLVEKPVLTGIAIASAPRRLVYPVGEALDITGLQVTGVYSDGSESPLAAEQVQVTGFDSAGPAAGQTLVVTAEGHTATFAVDIVDMRGLLRAMLRWAGMLR